MSDEEPCRRVQPTDRRVVIVGASLAGLTLALACAREGVASCMLERVDGSHRGGGALGINRDLLLRAVDADARSEAKHGFPALTNYRQAASWKAVHEWLRERMSRCAAITLLSGRGVLEVSQNPASATAVTATGDPITAGIIVGADGYQSVVRRAVDPVCPSATYAGYLLWRGLVGEEKLPSYLKLPKSNAGVALVTDLGYRLIAYPVAGPDGLLEPGRRSISFAWYDPFRGEFLRKSGCLSPAGELLASLPAKGVSAAMLDELRGLAEKIWPDPWRGVICHALERREIFATPIAEYSPRRLHNGRLAIIGDAAHVVSPVTGQGFAAAILDAQTLARSLRGAFGQSAAPDLPAALQGYSEARLCAAQALAALSAKWTRSYLRGVRLPSEPGARKNL